MKTLLIIKSAILLSLMEFGCAAQIKRPEMIPVNSKWFGGEDGGSWILCQKSKEQTYVCDIYFESGNLRAKNIVLNGDIYDWQNQIIAFDGEKIILRKIE